MRFRLIFQPQALRNLEDQYQFISRNNSLAANRWFNRFVDAIEAIVDAPERYSIARESALIGRDVRQLLFGKGGGMRRALFVIDGDTIRVLCIRHGAQQDISPEELLGGS